ncbi:UDP-N-acetyl-D-galactosamine dehydrogenase [Proteiniborus sp. DW1]|uniref:nucleotide sugar dehydrogenase n=1 Tax=Proteiniborus sp. DW1 TaxID=1889883 RepID=UPI00092E0481|nr:nucleotide sugar dehydrogenase [Proteiniborus sp. DW1]SCG83248.1 UDP-N-acetyl-D-galactosamine dehydrogenase [Proteiniborus sp. DW1]
MSSFKSLYENIVNKETTISVIGLGYVGLPLALAFSEVTNVVGFDIDERKIEWLKKGVDLANEIETEKIIKSNIKFTFDENDIKDSNFYVIAVPTPVNDDNVPDLRYIVDASRIVGRNLKEGSIVVYESTVYPGATEEVCVPILEEESRMKCGLDFKIGYSPERINPGDKIHTLKTIKKVVSAMDDESLEIISNIYNLILESEVYKAESIKVAEAAKIIENAQRDVNIAFINEVSIMMNNLGIDSKSVIETAATKWNFLKFVPGLVGGHCIGVDPYYLTYLSEKKGYMSQVILPCRRLNEHMSEYVVENTVKSLIKSGAVVKGARVGVLGLSFKENCSDIRNTKVMDIISKLKDFGIEVLVYDPVVDRDRVKREYDIELCDFDELVNINALLIAVAHDDFTRYDIVELKKRFSPDYTPILLDIKRIFERKTIEEYGFIYWGL